MAVNRVAAATVLALRIGVGVGLGAAFVSIPVAHGAAAAAAVSIQADVAVNGKAAAELGDKLYAAKDYAGALAAYGEGFAKTRDAAFIYAEAQCQKALGAKADAETMFKMYLSAAGKAKLKYEAEAKAELTGVKNAAKAVGGALLGAVKTVGTTVADLGLTVAGGVYTVLKVSVAAEMEGAAKVKAEAADAAYAAGKYADAARDYGAAFVASEKAVALFAAGQAQAQAGKAAEARAALTGYLAAEAKGKYADEAKQLLLAIGGITNNNHKVSVSGKVSAEAKANATTGDEAYKAGKYLSAAKAYAAGFAIKPDPALLYAQGMAEFAAGSMADAKTHLEAYLKSAGKLEFKANAQATLKAAGSAG